MNIFYQWGLGIGDWAQSPIPNPQSPIPNPHKNYLKLFQHKNIFLNYFKNDNIYFNNNLIRRQAIV